MIGKTISHYKILSELGRGGMGVVYKAEDTKLRRTVALKFLRSDLIEDPEHRERFLRKAQAAAALDHPNICTVHEIDEVEGETFIAMAFIEGQSVKDKIAERPLKLEEALDIAMQTAQGLQAAHQKEIVHRDIKPANLIQTEEGQLKVMDFGLAQLAERSRLTKTVTILGTPAYMSPEQAQRQPTDRRADIWSLGVVIYEMVTGKRPFEGEREQAVLYAIANEDPEPITALRAGLPMELELIVGKALAKDAAERYQHVEEMIVDLGGLSKKLASGKSTVLRPQPAAAPIQAPSEELGLRRKLRLQQALLAATAVVALALGLLYFRQAPPETPQAPLRRFGFTPPVAIMVGPNEYHPNLGISPNGRHIVFTAQDERRLWIHDLDRGESRSLEGTEGADDPFWSPGSDFIAYFSGAQIRTIPARGGVPIRVYQRPGSSIDRGPVTRLKGGTWSPDGNSIVFSEDERLYEIPARGGTPKLLVSPEESEQSSAEPSGGPRGLIRWPHFMPSEAGARVLVYTFGSVAERTMMVHDLESSRREILGPGELPSYSPSGHLLYQAGPTTYNLWALPFSLDTLQATGQAFPITQNGRLPTLATDGTLVYLDTSLTGQQQLVWLDRRSNKTGEIGQPQGSLGFPALSPDGRLVAVTATEGSNTDVWVYDIARGVRTRLSSAPERDSRPVWSPSAEEVAFSSGRAGNVDILLRQADGSGEAKVLVATPHREFLSDRSRDGKYLLYHLEDPETGPDLWYLERNEDGSGWEPHPFLQTPFTQGVPRFSPDGRYVAYVSGESGQFEVYVQPFPEGGRKVTVSSNGGRKVRWRRDGKELFYVEGETLVAVSVSSGSSFSVGSATRLFEHPGLRPGNNYPPYDISADGQRFVLAEPAGAGAEAPGPSIRVVMNWYEEFRDREQD